MSRRFRFSRGDVIADLQRNQGFTQAQLDGIAATLGKGQWEQWISFEGTFTAPWQAVDTYPWDVSPKYRKNSANVVQLAGLVGAVPIGNGASTQEMCHLPVGYRPSGRNPFAVLTFEAGWLHGQVDVESGVGALVYMSGGREYISLNNIFFIAEN